jgi:sugar phosphate isomerase/epimerase
MDEATGEIKLSFSTLACPSWTLRQILEAAVASGYRGVDFRGIGEEIDITRLPAFTREIDATLAFFREYNIEMPCLNTSVTLVSPSAQRWQEMLDECRRYAQLAGRTGTRMLRIFGGAVPADMTRQEAVIMARRHLRQLVKICHAHACQPILETHDAWVAAAQIMELLHEFTSDEVGVLWDIEHTHRAGESAGDTVAGLRRFIRHVHFKDSLRVDGKNDPRLLGQGDLPIGDCLSALRHIGFAGWIALETEKRWHDEAPDPEVSIPQFAAYMKPLLV